MNIDNHFFSKGSFLEDIAKNWYSPKFLPFNNNDGDDDNDDHDDNCTIAKGPGSKLFYRISNS